MGNNNVIHGDNNIIRGSNNTVYGSNNKLYGDENRTIGENNQEFPTHRLPPLRSEVLERTRFPTLNVPTATTPLRRVGGRGPLLQLPDDYIRRISANNQISSMIDAMGENLADEILNDAIANIALGENLFTQTFTNRTRLNNINTENINRYNNTNNINTRLNYGRNPSFINIGTSTTDYVPQRSRRSRRYPLIPATTTGLFMRPVPPIPPMPDTARLVLPPITRTRSLVDPTYDSDDDDDFGTLNLPSLSSNSRNYRNIRNITLEKKDDSKADHDKEQCAICYENKKCVLYTPCNHVASCNNCAQQILAKTKVECPLCRESIQKLTHIFL
jgi:hypothetical protein